MRLKAMKSKSKFGWEIGAALVLKVIGLATLYVLFFIPAHRPVMTDRGLAAHLFSAASASPADTLVGGRND